MKDNLVQRRSIDILSKLLAEENITIVHDPLAKTASFYPNERKLVFPTYGDQINTITQVMLALHETGHATDTPASLLKLFKVYGKSVINILEDVRIEKIVKIKFPGSVRFFSEGYRELVLEHNFFGTASKDNPFDFSGFNFLDRVNIHFKLGSVAMVPFNRAEQKLVDEIAAIETVAELEVMAKKLKELAKDNDSKTDTHQNQPEESGEDADPEAGDAPDANPDFDEESEELDYELGDDDESESGEGSDEDTLDGEDGEESEEGESSSSSDEESEESEESEEGDASGSDSDEEGDDSDSDSDETEDGDDGETGNGDPSDSDEGGESDDGDVDLSEDDLEESETENASNETLEKLAENAGRVGTLPKSSEIDNLVQPWTDIDNFVSDIVNKGTFAGSYVYGQGYEKISINETLVEFRKGTKAVLNKMVSEFNRNSAGTVSRRTAYKDTGVLDPNKMVHYRYNENIFKKRKYVRDGKNHGVCLFVDFTGSMHRRIRPIMRQVVLMVDFCRKINIPFRVYGWSDRYLPSNNGGYFNPVRKTQSYSRFDNVAFVEIFNSTTMSDATLEKFSKWCMTGSGQTPGGSTPLVSSMHYALPIVKKFRKEAGVDIMKLMMFTDGQGHTNLPAWGSDSWSDEETGKQYSRKEINDEFHVTDEFWSMRSGDAQQIRFLSDVMKDRYNVDTVFMFMNDKAHCTTALKSNQWTPEEVKAAQKSLNKMGIAKAGDRGPFTFICIKDGYDVATEKFTMDVPEGRNIKTVFKNESLKRKGSTLFATLVAESLVEMS